MKQVDLTGFMAQFPRPTSEDNARIIKEQQEAKEREVKAEMARRWESFKFHMPKKFEKSLLKPFVSEKGIVSQNQEEIIKFLGTTKLIKSPASAVFHGSVGLGKTYLASNFGRRWIVETDKNGFFITEADFVRLYAKEDSKYIEEKDFLIFDDVAGMIEQWDIKKVQKMLFNRFENNRPTLITTNMTLGDLQEYVGARVWDRMKDVRGANAIFVNFGNGKSLRGVV